MCGKDVGIYLFIATLRSQWALTPVSFKPSLMLSARLEWRHPKYTFHLPSDVGVDHVGE
jgi:hypothetical protein